jgi:ribosomal protein L24
MKVIVEGVNIKKVHQKARSKDGKGQIVEKTMPIYASTVKLSK